MFIVWRHQKYGYENVNRCESPKWKACCKYDDRGTIWVLRVKILFKKGENICLYIERRKSSLPLFLLWYFLRVCRSRKLFWDHTSTLTNANTTTNIKGRCRKGEGLNCGGASVGIQMFGDWTCIVCPNYALKLF